jgi:hypothetical protein
MHRIQENVMALEQRSRYLADAHEREEGARFYVGAFGEGQTRQLDIVVGPTGHVADADKIEDFIRARLAVEDVTRTIRKGWFFRQLVLRARLEPRRIEWTAMRAIADVQYDLILSFDVSVEVVPSG